MTNRLDANEGMTSGYRERMRRLALFDPLKDLGNRERKDELGTKIDMRGLGMLTLLFFFEKRLMREYEIGIVNVTDFLLTKTSDIYQLNRTAMEKQVRDIIQLFRPSTGKRRQFAFFNWETKEHDVIEYAILKDNGFDATTQTQYYTLDDDGLEFLFATKEFYSEFQISINQLLLKQQIKKGQFQGALRQVREMDIDVGVLREQMQKMKLEILRSIVSEETFERYKKLLDDTYIRFEREDDEFKALTKLMKETRKTIYTDHLQQKDASLNQLITKIAKELEEVHYEHARLLELTTDLRITALSTAQESLYYTGMQSFNFDQDIVSKVLAQPLTTDKMKGVLHPFLHVEENRTWSPLSIFAAQNITDRKLAQEEMGFAEAQKGVEKDLYQEWLAGRYAEIMDRFLLAYEDQRAHTLKEWVSHLQENEAELLDERAFYAFWLHMHQLSPVTNERQSEEEGRMVIDETLRLLKRKRLIIEKLPGIIQVTKRYSMQNMRFQLEDEYEL